MKPVHLRFRKCQDLFSSRKWKKSNDVINDVMACHAWITCQWREWTDLKECVLNNCWNKFDIYTPQGSLLLNQNKKNIKIYSIQKTYTIERHHKVTSYANSTSLFTAYDTKFMNRKLFETTEDIIKIVMKPFRVVLISLLFDVHFCHSSATLLSVNNLTESALLVLFAVLGRCVTSLFIYVAVDLYPFVSNNRQATKWQQYKQHVDGNRAHVAGQHVYLVKTRLNTTLGLLYNWVCVIKHRSDECFTLNPIAAGRLSRGYRPIGWPPPQ